MHLKYLFVLSIFSLLSACSSLPTVIELPEQAQESKMFKVEQNSPKVETSLLVIQFSDQQWRWVQTDPLGIPLSRVLLTKDGWQNDGFVPPNAEAKWLFSAIATYLNPNHPLFSFSKIVYGPDINTYFINRHQAWKIGKQGHNIYIQLPKSEWLIEEMAQ
ncbi:hypothetical protein [Otariodibacter oris]|uniref:Lipoprotein n=1 Tax=Otariodibacter oris TaxID=1032623 RepID=A0A420XGK6_9PAST|nr:hypothetical protein [Otariodibacter oris]QGM79978.1 hypothetical protein A6A10_00440 [Otariodibacter oris]RKR71801.1 hypothetical protein DES31_1150 [Otariodibacter oris]